MGSDDEIEIAGQRFGPGAIADAEIAASESSAGNPVVVPVRVWRGPEPGPVVSVTGTVHGDEINGLGAVRTLILEPGFELRRGTLLLTPVVSVPAFERSSRYMPDRRDPNRAFPGTPTGSLTSRFVHAVFSEVVVKADYLIDLHSAAQRRTNYPNVRADLDHPGVRALAELFGAELVVHGRGPEGSLRRAAVEAGVPAIILEAGEPWKFEPAMMEVAVRGVRSVLAGLGMIDATPDAPHTPQFRVFARETRWVRSDHGGILRFHVGPGDDVDAGQVLATVTTLLGRELGRLEAPEAGVVLGMTTMPTVVPGDPFCHIAYPEGGIEAIRRSRRRARGETLDERLREGLATNMVLTEHDDGAEA